MKNTYWLSFVRDKINVGICIVDADNEIAATQRSHELGINPGGEVLIYNMNDMEGGLEEATRLGRDRLISKKELEVRQYKSLNELEKEVAEGLHNLGEVVHEHCNEEIKHK